MAALGAPVGKDAFFDALSSRERTAFGVPEATAAGLQDAEDAVDARTELAEEASGDAGGDQTCRSPPEHEAPSDSEESRDLGGFAEPASFQEQSSGDDEGPSALPVELAFAGGLRGELRDRMPVQKGVLSAYRGATELKLSLENQRVVKGMESLRHRAAVTAATAEDVRSALEDEEKKLRALKRQAAEGTLADPTLLSFQEKEVKSAWVRLTEVEKARDDADLAMHRSSGPAGVEAAQDLEAEAEEAAELAARRGAQEAQRGRGVVREAMQQVDRIRDREEMFRQAAAQREQAAAEGTAKGKERLSETHKVHKARSAEAERVREAEFQGNAARVLELKASVDENRKQMQSANERRSKKEAARKHEQRQQKIDLLNSGLNPYEVWRREEMDAVKEEQIQKWTAQKALRNERLVQQMLEEDVRDKRKVKEAKQKRVQADEFGKEVGVYAREKKVAAYIRKMTIGNVEVLDPTGKAMRIDASKVTVQKTGAFGIGTASPAEIEHMEATVRRQKALNASRRPPKDDSMDFGAMEVGDQDEARGSPATLRALEQQESGKLWAPELTKLEQQYLAAARERQKQNITSVQRCWGKEFSGPAFLASPSIIEFKDFEVGKRYRQIIALTNVSLTFNQFKLLPLEDSVTDFFEVQFVPPGRMSAGVTRYITLWFTPKFSKDIDTTFPILAKTGRIDFPLRCVTKKTVLAITPQGFDEDAHGYIDFGQVLAGESSTKKLRVRNYGALAPTFEISVMDPSSRFLEKLSWTPSKGEFPSDPTTIISFTFAPSIDFVGDYSTRMNLSIKNGADGDAAFEQEMQIIVDGSCVDVPIYFPEEEMDLKVCIYGTIYRENVVLRNRRKTTMQVDIVQPKEFPGELQITPTTAYVQGNSDQIVAVKFSPREDFLARHPEFRDPKRPDDSGAFRIPLKACGADQLLPAHAAIVGTLTQNMIYFEPSKLNFDKCYLGSAVSSRLAIVNPCLLPQKYAFARLPSFLSLHEVPDDVREEESERMIGQGSAVLEGGPAAWYGNLLPGERRELVVTYAPEAAIDMSHSMACKVISGGQSVRDFSVLCKGQGVAPLVKLSHTQVDMASIPRGTIASESIIVTNVSRWPCMINVVLPPKELSAIQGSPICYMLEQNESRRLLLQFSPTEAYLQLLTGQQDQQQEDAEAAAAAEPPPPEPEPAAPEPKAKGKAKAKAAAAPVPEPTPPAEEERPKTPPPSPEEVRKKTIQSIRVNGGRRWDKPENRTVHASWRVPIYIRQIRPTKAEEEEPASPQNGKSKKRDAVTYFGLSTCVLPDALVADRDVLDFGDVTAQERAVLALELENEVPEEPQDLHVEPLPEGQCFTVLNAPRPIGAKTFSLFVEFKPGNVQDYETVLKLRTQNSRVQIPLRGRGVRPVLKIEPADGLLHLGAIVYGKEAKDYTTATLTVMNESAFELRFDLQAIVQADVNHTGPPPFTLSPAAGVVEANGKQTVTVTFRPHRPMGMFRQKILVNVPNQQEPTYVYLFGHCFKYQAYAIHDVEPAPFGRLEAKKAEGAFTDALAVGLGSGVGEAGEFEYPRAMLKNFCLRFEGEEQTKCLMMGGCVAPGTPAAPQTTSAMTFEFKIEDSEFSKLFTVEAMEEKGAKPDKVAKGAIAPGKAGPRVAFKFNPPQDSSLSVGGLNLDLLSGIGQWVSCIVKGTLNGGCVPPGAPNALQEITVELKAYLQQI